MIDNCPFGCAVVDCDMNGGIMACTFKYRYVVEAVNGGLGWETGRRVADFRFERGNLKAAAKIHERPDL